MQKLLCMQLRWIPTQASRALTKIHVGYGNEIEHSSELRNGSPYILEGVV